MGFCELYNALEDFWGNFLKKLRRFFDFVFDDFLEIFLCNLITFSGQFFDNVLIIFGHF